MGLPKLWGKDSSGAKGFIFAHVKTVYYNWSQKKLLSTKLDEMDASIDKKAPKSHASSATTYGAGNASNYGHVKLSDNYTSSSGAAANSVAASSKAVADAYAKLNTDKANATNPTLINPTLRFLLGEDQMKVEFRRSGSTSEDLSIVFTNSSGTNTFYTLIDETGEWNLPPISHASTEWTYGVGTSTNYGHCRIIDNLTTSENHSVYALSAYQGYVLNNKLGKIQILNIASLNCVQSTSVANGSTWSSVTGTISSVSGASGYYYIPIACNFGFVTKVSISGTTVTCTALNASGAAHTCTINGLVIAYKSI